MRQLLVLGGGGFANLDNKSLEKYILQQVNKTEPSICFIPTASEDNEEHIRNFYRAFSTEHCKPTHITISDMKKDSLVNFIEQQDIFYIGDGNLNYMINTWGKYKLDVKLQEAFYKGKVIVGAGTSAIYWFEEGLDVVESGEYDIVTGLGLIKDVLCPAYNNLERSHAFLKFIGNGRIFAGIAVDEGTLVHYKNGNLVKCIVSKKNSSAYYFSTDHKYNVNPIEVLLLD